MPAKARSPLGLIIGEPFGQHLDRRLPCLTGQARQGVGTRRDEIRGDLMLSAPQKIWVCGEVALIPVRIA